MTTKHTPQFARVMDEIEMDLRKGNIDLKQADAARAAVLALDYRIAPVIDALTIEALRAAIAMVRKGNGGQ